MWIPAPLGTPARIVAPTLYRASRFKGTRTGQLAARKLR